MFNIPKLLVSYEVNSYISHRLPTNGSHVRTTLWYYQETPALKVSSKDITLWYNQYKHKLKIEMHSLQHGIIFYTIPHLLCKEAQKESKKPYICPALRI